MKFVDIHTHKKYLKIKDIFAVLNLEFCELLEFRELSEPTFFSIGFHPWHIQNDYTEKNRLILNECAQNKYFVFVGECGLDKNTEARIVLKKQIEIFEEQIRLSEEAEKALIIHCVGRFNELIEIKKVIRPKQKWIIHGFRGKPQLADQLLRAACNLSFGEYFNEESVKLTPFENLFLETDESQLSINEIYKRTASAKKCDIEDLCAGADFLKSLNISSLVK